MKNIIWKFFIITAIVTGFSFQTYAQTSKSRIVVFEAGTIQNPVEISSICPGELLSFSVSSDPLHNATGATYSWDFGDGNISTEAKPEHFFTQKNTVNTVSVDISYSDGFAETLTKTIIVHKRPDAEYSYSDEEAVCENGVIELGVDIAAGNSVLWATGETTQTIYIDKSDLKDLDPVTDRDPWWKPEWATDGITRYVVEASVYDNENLCYANTVNPNSNVPLGTVIIYFYKNPNLNEIPTPTYKIHEDPDGNGLPVTLEFVEGVNDDPATFVWNPSASVKEVSYMNYALTPTEEGLMRYDIDIKQTHTVADQVDPVVCEATATVEVNVEHIKGNQSTKFEANNVFIPGASTANSYWRMAGDNDILWYEDCQLIIYNVWGQEVYSRDVIGQSEEIWDGKTNDGKELPADTYYYLVRCSNCNCEPSPQNNSHTGYVTIIRK